jgi:uncharacterized membrane protein
MVSKIQLLLLFLGYLTTVLYAGATYAPLRQSPYYPYLSAMCALILGLSWGLIAKSNSNPSQVYFLAAIWDVGVSLIWILMPIVLCGVSLNSKQMIGVTLMILGCLLLK